MRAYLLHPYCWPSVLGNRQTCIIGGDRLLQTRRPALPLPQTLQRVAAIVLRHRPVERHPLARPLLERLVIGGGRLLQTRRPALPLPQSLQRGAAVVLRHRPVERHPLVRPLLERLVIGGDRL